MSATVLAAAAFSIFAQATTPSPRSPPNSVYAAVEGEIGHCARQVADEFASKSFDQILDQAVLRCGGFIPFPVPPVEHRAVRQTTMTEQQIQDRKERQDQTTRRMIARDLRAIIDANPQPGRAPK
jgi:hypothetical protein